VTGRPKPGNDTRAQMPWKSGGAACVGVTINVASARTIQILVIETSYKQWQRSLPLPGRRFGRGATPAAAIPRCSHDFFGVGTGRPAISKFTDPSVFLVVK
jgi:hypothetical protein